jgi:hypothetical protein
MQTVIFDVCVTKNHFRLSVAVLNVGMLGVVAPNDDCRYANCGYAKCHYATCH